MITAGGVGAVVLAIAATITAVAVEAEATAVIGAAINVAPQGGRCGGEVSQILFSFQSLTCLSFHLKTSD
jgi:hypothetical protein